MLHVVDGESIVPLFTGGTPKRTHPIYFGNKGMAVMDNRYKLVKNGNGKGPQWELYDLEKDFAETTDLADEQPDRVKRMQEQAMAIAASIDASEQGKDYPEGKVIQPQRSAVWSDMKEYQALYERFAELKPGWEAPGQKSKKKKRESR